MTFPANETAEAPASPYVPRITAARPLAALLALAIAAGYFFIGYSTVLADFGGDATAYWLTAQGWSPWFPATPLQREFAAGSTYPPLYPLVLAWTGASQTLLAAHLATVALLLGGIGALCWFCRRAGLDGLATTGIAVTYACCATVRYEGLDLHSEPLYLLWSMAALGAGIALARRPQAGLALLLGALVAAALLTRSAGLTLLIALAATGIRRREGVWFLALLPGLFALAVNTWLQGSAQRYSGEFLAQWALSGLAEKLLQQLHALAAGWTVAIAGQGAPLFALWVLGFCGLVALAAACCRAWQGHFDGFYGLCSLALVLVWPYPAETVRLLMPLLGLALAQVCLAARSIWDCRKTLALRQAWVLVLLFALVDTARFASRFTIPLPEGLAPYRHTLFWHQPDATQALGAIGFMQGAVALLDKLPALVPAGECVYAIKPSIVAALGGRPSRAPPPAQRTDSEFQSDLAAGGCRYLLLLRIFSPSYPEPFYPAARMKDSLQVVASASLATQPDQPAALLARRLPPP